MRDGQRPTGFVRLWRAMLNTLRGLQGCYRSEAAFRQETWLALVLVPLGLVVGASGVERALLVGSVLLLLLVELLNTGLEVVVDRVGTEQHRLSGFAKDLGSAAVFLAIVVLVVTWALVLLD